MLAVGRLVHGKGFEDLIRGWVAVVSHHSDARLTIVGDGPLRGRLQGLTDLVGVSGSVRFVGALAAHNCRAELVELYQGARVVVQPSHHEGLSTVLLEAMACETPVVATAVGAHSVVISDGVNGRLIPPNQPADLARAVSDLLADPARAGRLGQQGRATVVESYSWTSVARPYAAVYMQSPSGDGRVH